MANVSFQELAVLALADINKILAQYLPEGKQYGHEFVVKNPVRSDSNPGSFKINTSTGIWADFATGDGGNDLISLIAYLSHSKQGEAAKALTELLGLDSSPGGKPQVRKVTGYYVYTDEKGLPVLKVERVEPGKTGKKDFYQYHHDKDGWQRGANGNFLLFNLPEVIASSSVFFVEGEKKTLALKKLGFCATCIPGGAKEKLSVNIKKELDRLHGKDVVILPDFDDVGRGFASMVAAYLSGKATSIKVVTLPDLPPKGDIVNWVTVAGNDRERLLNLVQDTPVFGSGTAETSALTTVVAGTGKRPRQQDTALTLLEIAAEIPLFHDDMQTGWVYLNNETIPVESQMFQSWLTLQHLNTLGTIPGAEAINLATRAMKSRAIYEAECKSLYNRVAWHEGSILVDLGNGKAQKITAEGHETVTAPPLFRRWPHQQPQELPLPGGDPFDFLRFCRVADNERHTVLIALITAFIPGIAQPLWDISGPEGSGKSSFCRLVKRIVDPSAAELQIMQPERETDFFLILLQNYLINLDNLSSISGRMSDLLCGASTGTAVSQRQHYSNLDTVLLRLKNIVLINGINPDLVSRADLRDRAFRISLDRIPAGERQEERIILAEFNAAIPGILGGIFTVLSKALQIYPTVQLDELPRLADWYRYAYSVAEALGGHGARFVADYASSKATQREESISLNSLATALLEYMHSRNTWETVVGEAWSILFDVAYPPETDEGSKNKSRDQRKPKTDTSFPGKPQDMRRYLERLKVTLLDSGIVFKFLPRCQRGVPLVFTKTQPVPVLEEPIINELYDIVFDESEIF